MTPASSAFAAPRVTPNPRRAFGGILRLTASRLRAPGHWLAVAGMIAALGVFAYAALTARNGPTMYIGWLTGFYFTFVVPVLAFISGGGAVRDDLKAGTVDYVFTRPLRRSSYVVFKYLAHVA